jgi:predicted RNA-binding protein with PIN domain
MSRHYLIDGYNVARHAAFPGSGTDERGDLISLIINSRLCGSSANRVEVFFDGYPPSSGRQSIYPSVQVVFSGERSADDEIISRVSSAAHPRAICVVSADGKIVSAARACGATVIDPRDFLGAGVKKGPPGKDKEEPRPVTTGQRERINEELRKLWLEKKKQ